MKFESAKQDIAFQSLHVTTVDPYGSHYDIWFGAVFRERLSGSPHMVGQVGGAIAQIRCEEIRERIYEDSSDGDGDDEGCYDVSRGVSTVTRKGSAERIVRDKEGGFRRSEDTSVRMCASKCASQNGEYWV